MTYANLPSGARLFGHILDTSPRTSSSTPLPSTGLPQETYQSVPDGTEHNRAAVGRPDRTVVGRRITRESIAQPARDVTSGDVGVTTIEDNDGHGLVVRRQVHPTEVARTTNRPQPLAFAIEPSAWDSVILVRREANVRPWQL